LSTNTGAENEHGMSKRTYDHRVRNAIARSGNSSLFPELNIPRTTAQQWILEGEKEVVTTHQFTKAELELVVEVENLKTELTQSKTKLAFGSITPSFEKWDESLHSGCC
jgi:hypothetical protein